MLWSPGLHAVYVQPFCLQTALSCQGETQAFVIVLSPAQVAKVALPWSSVPGPPQTRGMPCRGLLLSACECAGVWVWLSQAVLLPLPRVTLLIVDLVSSSEMAVFMVSAARSR